VAVEQGADDAAVEDAAEGLMVLFGRTVTDELVALLEAPDAKALLVRGTAPETAVLRCVLLLQAGDDFEHGGRA
jgi:hypothetical protein